MSATIDHIIPIAKGGHPSDMSNLQLAHRACNRLKGTKMNAEIPKVETDPNRDLPQSMDWRTA
jgi:5-methylcytosine-specific restriction endonuclease McrA